MGNILRKPEHLKTDEDRQREYMTQESILRFQAEIEKLPKPDYAALRQALKLSHDKFITYAELMIAYEEFKS